MQEATILSRFDEQVSLFKQAFPGVPVYEPDSNQDRVVQFFSNNQINKGVRCFRAGPVVRDISTIQMFLFEDLSEVPHFCMITQFLDRKTSQIEQLQELVKPSPDWNGRKPDVEVIFAFILPNFINIRYLIEKKKKGTHLSLSDLHEPSSCWKGQDCPVFYVVIKRLESGIHYEMRRAELKGLMKLSKRPRTFSPPKIQSAQELTRQKTELQEEKAPAQEEVSLTKAPPSTAPQQISPVPSSSKQVPTTSEAPAPGSPQTQWEPKSYKEPEPFLSQLKYIELDSIEKATDFSTYVHLLGYICDVPTESFSLQKFVLYSFNAKAVKVKDSLTTIMSLLKQRGEATIIETSWSKREDVTYRANIQFSIRPDGLFICFQPIKPKEEIRKEFRNLLAQNERAEAEETRILKRLCANPKGFFSFLKNAHLEIRDLTVSDKGVQASKKVEASTQVAFEHNEPCCLPWHHAAKNLEDKTKVVVYHSDILPGMM